jgi:hypothetical protein
MSKTVCNETLHQQEGMSLADFAQVTGKTASHLARLAQKGRIIGARKHPLSKKWWVYPLAKLVDGRQL